MKIMHLKKYSIFYFIFYIFKKFNRKGNFTEIVFIMTFYVKFYYLLKHMFFYILFALKQKFWMFCWIE